MSLTDPSVDHHWAGHAPADASAGGHVLAEHAPAPSGPHPAEPADAGGPAGAWWVDPAPRLTDQQAADLAHAHAFVTTAGMAFYPVDDQIRDFAHTVAPAPGYVTLDLHGSPEGFLIDGQLIGPSQFASALRGLVDDGVLALPEGAGIKLLSCDTAVGGVESPAAVLARELGVEVIAPDQPVWTGLDGTEVVASAVLVAGVWLPAEPPDGSWHRFVGATSGSDTVRPTGSAAPRQ